jgi:hypothetical protein
LASILFIKVDKNIISLSKNLTIKTIIKNTCIGLIWDCMGLCGI